MSAIEKIVEVFRVMSEKGLLAKSAVPPQFQDPKIASQFLDEWIREGVDSNDLSELLMKGLEEYRNILEGKEDNVDRQIDITKKILPKEQQNPDIWCHLATMLKKKGDFKTAKVCFGWALFLSPNHSDANYNFGNLLRDQGDFQGAERCYRKCIEVNPDDFNAHNNLGDLLHRMNRFEEAEKEFQKVIEIFPLHSKAYNNLGILYFSQKDYEKAEKYFRKALEIDPNYQKAKENLSKLLAVKILQKQGNSLSLRDFQTFGKAEIIENGIKIGSIITDSAFSTVGGVNITVRDLEKYKDFKFDFEIEEGNAGGILEMNFLGRESSPPLLTYPFPIADDYLKMTISGPIQPSGREKIDLSKISIIQFVLRSILPGRFESPLVWIRNFQLSQ